ncbi:hypothetical protein NQ315_012072 [Exocentrus adspersus]|uniref:ABC-type xenobiotic transporter n=1 Tax=Exocentrus adspersus TaxID=1586481 RepID=A0AAV8VYY2_9CUCU|nr:hypothetical protein NQ315_012072 [Exocentrus adspersus]
MGRNTYDLEDTPEKKAGVLDNVEFVKEENQDENFEDKREYSFHQLYRFATRFDLFLLTLGLLSAVGTGIVQPLNTILFGNLAGDIINYAAAINNNESTTEDIQTATDTFMESIRYFAIMNSLIGVAMFVFSYISTETFNYSALRQIFRVRSEYLRKVLNQDVAWYDLHQTGDFASRMSEDISKFEDGIGEKVPMFLNFQVVFVASLVVAFIHGWELALICLSSLPASMLALGVIAGLTAKLAKKELDAYSAAGSVAEEVLSNIRTVVAFGGQKKEIERYDKSLIFAKNNNIKRSMFAAIGFGLLWFIIYSSYALAFWYGVKLILDERGTPDPTYTPANMVTVFFSVMTGSMNFAIASPYIEAFGISKAAGNRIFQVIDSVPEINLSKDNGEKIDNLKGNIKFRKVHFQYPSRKEAKILQGLDLDIDAGETVALVGTSGCGKSTVVQLIQRFYDPVEGEVYIDGKNLRDLDLTWLRNNIGVVGQEPVLFGTTIKENILFGNRKATEEDIKNAAKKANAHEFIKALPNGYDTLVGERGAQLSGGQKQRIAIARALVRNPAILLLDEATSALDNHSEAKVQAALDSASKECTTIIVAHRLSTIRGANKIVVISDGCVVEQGTHDELMALKSEYYSLVTTQVQSNEILARSESRYSDVKFDDDKDNVSLKKEQLEPEDNEEDMNLDKKDSVIEVMKMNSPEWPHILIGCIGAIVMGCAMPVIAVLFGDILGTLSTGDDDTVRREANRICLYFVIAGVVSGINTFLQMFMFGIAGEKLTKRIRSQMFQAMLQQEIGYFDRKANGVGALCARLSGDAASVQGATGQRIGTILQSIATLVLAVTLSMYYEWRLGLLAMAFTPLILIATFFERRNTSNLNDSRNESLQKSVKIAVEGVGNVRTVASLGCEETFHQMYMTELSQYHKKNLLSTHWRSAVFGLSRSLMFFAYAACMYYGGFLIRDGLSYENVFKVSQALIMGTVSIANALAFTPNFTKGIEAAKKVRELLTRIPEIRDSPHSRDKDEAKGDITYQAIHFAYPTRQSIEVLKGLDLSVLQNKTVALVGPSGCGKSTIIQMTERFYDPSFGEIFLDQDELKSVTLHSLRSYLGIVSQEPNLFNKTIAENIAYGDNSREVEMSEIIEVAKNANIHNFVSALPTGYDTKLGEKGTQLSGGQKQRIAIARALVRNPKILLLDEATSALDAESEKVVQAALENAKKGRTCIIIAHRLTTIQDADLICVINAGIIAEMGTHSELLQKRGLYYKLHSHQPS